jgi:urea carboxylase-associated protein 2
MGRIFCSITDDAVGWHDTVGGNSTRAMLAERGVLRTYQTARNDWTLNGHDSFLIEAGKYGLGRRDLAANVNWFSKVATDAEGRLTLVENHSRPGSAVTLRFDMDTLVLLHSCPHPLSQAEKYPTGAVQIELANAAPVSEDDYCVNFRPENQRGFRNNALYHLGHGV